MARFKPVCAGRLSLIGAVLFAIAGFLGSGSTMWIIALSCAVVGSTIIVRTRKATV